jgi:hypothetical protein
MPAPASWSEAVCWPCGGAAEAGCAFTATLLADRKRAPDAIGYAVSNSQGALRVRVTVPRCRECRARSRGDAFAVVFGLADGAAVSTGGYWCAWRQGLLPDTFPAGDGEFTLWVLVFSGAFVGAILGYFLRMRALRRRQLTSGGSNPREYNDFPPIAALRERGWDWPSSE